PRHRRRPGRRRGRRPRRRESQPRAGAENPGRSRHDDPGQILPGRRHQGAAGGLRADRRPGAAADPELPVSALLPGLRVVCPGGVRLLLRHPPAGVHRLAPLALRLAMVSSFVLCPSSFVLRPSSVLLDLSSVLTYLASLLPHLSSLFAYPYFL